MTHSQRVANGQKYGLLARGKPKRYSEAELERRRGRMLGVSRKRNMITRLGERLHTELTAFAAALEAAYSPETAYQGVVGRSKSAGHCAVVAALVRTRFGGRLVSAQLFDADHWFNRITVQGREFDLDLTADQFGYPPGVNLALAGKLHPDARPRELEEFEDEALKRMHLLAERVDGVPQ